MRNPLNAIAMLSPILGLAAIGCGGGDGPGVQIDIESRNLGSVNDSGYEGEFVLLSAGGEETHVMVALGDEDQPNGDFEGVIQTGTCDGLSGEVVHELGTLQSGVLTTSVPASMDSLTENDHVLVLYESQDRSVYVACGNVN